MKIQQTMPQQTQPYHQPNTDNLKRFEEDTKIHANHCSLSQNLHQIHAYTI